MLSEVWTTEYNDFVQHCCIKDPEKRPTCLQALDHPWLKDAEQHKEEFIATIKQHVKLN